MKLRSWRISFPTQLSLGDTGAQLVGLAWLAIAVGFMVAGIGIWRTASWAGPVAGVLAVASLVVCILGLPETAAGIAVNLVILVGIVVVALRPARTITRAA